MHTAANSVVHKRTKHLDIDCHIIKMKVQERLMGLLPIPSTSQVAGIFTKTSNPRPFQVRVVKFGLVDIFHPLTWRVPIDEL